MSVFIAPFHALLARLRVRVFQTLVAVLAAGFAWVAGMTGGAGDALDEALPRKFDVCADEDIRDV